MSLSMKQILINRCYDIHFLTHHFEREYITGMTDMNNINHHFQNNLQFTAVNSLAPGYH